MRKKIRLNLILLIFMLFAFKAYSCTCINKLDVKDAIKSNDYIFVGKVQKLELVDIENREFFKVLFEVKSRFNGRIKKYITIYTPSEPNLCGFTFNLKSEYIVYANLYKSIYVTKSKKLRNIIITDVCSRTRLYDKVEILKLRKHKKEKPVKRKFTKKIKAIIDDE